MLANTTIPTMENTMKNTAFIADTSDQVIFPNTPEPQKRNKPPATLLRQVTNEWLHVGQPYADAKHRENNEINGVGPGDEGYLPLSHEHELVAKYYESFVTRTSENCDSVNKK